MAVAMVVCALLALYLPDELPERSLLDVRVGMSTDSALGLVGGNRRDTTFVRRREIRRIEVDRVRVFGIDGHASVFIVEGQVERISWSASSSSPSTAKAVADSLEARLGPATSQTGTTVRWVRQKWDALIVSTRAGKVSIDIDGPPPAFAPPRVHDD